MNEAFPYSQVELTEQAAAVVAGFALTDEDDRHVIVAAVAAEAMFLCSDDRTGFPTDVMEILGIEWVTADALLSALVEEVPETMRKVHQMVVARLQGATDESTIAALRRAKAERTADLLETLVKTT